MAAGHAHAHHLYRRRTRSFLRGSAQTSRFVGTVLDFGEKWPPKTVPQGRKTFVRRITTREHVETFGIQPHLIQIVGVVLENGVSNRFQSLQSLVSVFLYRPNPSTREAPMATLLKIENPGVWSGCRPHVFAS